MDIEIIAAIVDGGLGVVGLCVIAFLSWKVISNMFQELRKINEANNESQKKAVDALNALASNINKLQDSTVCKAERFMGERPSEWREAEREGKS